MAKRFFTVLVAASAVTASGLGLLFAGQENAAMATRDQALVSGAISELKLELIEENPQILGGPMKYRVTKETLKFLTDKTVTVEPDGSLKIQ